MMAASLSSRTFCRLLTISCRIVIQELIRNKHRSINNVREIKFGPLSGKSIFLKPFRMTYKQNDKERYYDLMDMLDSVAVLVYNTTRNVFIFVKQFRPGVYYVNIPVEARHKPIDMAKYPAELGMTIELCAGVIDKKKSFVQIIKEEVLEECGYDVPVKNFEPIHAFNGNINISGTILEMYYCEVTDKMKGAGDNAAIDVVEMTLKEFKQFTSKTYIRSPGSLLVAYYWFKVNKPQYCK